MSAATDQEGISIATSDGDDRPTLSRRAWTRLAILGASGLSFLPGCLLRKGGGGGGGAIRTCYVPVRPGGSAEQTTLLARWARLGRVWREMTSHYRGEGTKEDFAQLQAEMEAALDGLPAWPELRKAFLHRWTHIDESRYPTHTCYKMVSPNPPVDAAARVEERVEELTKLVEAGTLTKEAAAKAARALAAETEVILQAEEAVEASDDYFRTWSEIHEAHEAGEIEPRPGADLAGKRLAEMTVDDIGLLAGPPQEGEGEVPEDALQEG